MDDTRLTRREAIGIGSAVALSAVALSASGAAASDDDLTRPTLSLRTAQRILAAAIEKAEEIGVPMYMLIVDDGGNEKASVRMDRNSLAALELVPRKAKTAVSFRTPTHVLAENVASNPARSGSFLSAGFSLLGGGLPIVVDGQLLGAIGVGGGSPEQDVVVGQAGLAAI